MTRMEMAKKGEHVEAFARLADTEHSTYDTISDGIASGEISLCTSAVRDIPPVAIGSGLRIKINANIGTSSDASSIEEEKIALSIGSHTAGIGESLIGSFKIADSEMYAEKQRKKESALKK